MTKLAYVVGAIVALALLAAVAEMTTPTTTKVAAKKITTPPTATPTPAPKPKPPSVKERYKREKFYCSDGRAKIAVGGLFTSDEKSTDPAEHRFCQTNTAARYKDEQFFCDAHDTSLTREEKRFCTKEVSGWHYEGKRKPEPVKPSDDCASKAAALMAAALLSGHPITAVEAAKIAADTAGTGEKC